MKKEEQAKAFAITNYSGTKESDYVMAVSKNSFEAGYTTCQEDQQKAWSESCKCSVNDRHGETWCCNNCGLPTAIASQEEDRWIPVSERSVKKTGYYICYIESTKSVMPMWNLKGQWNNVDSAIIHNNELRPVTHYKLLPNPPNK